MMIVQLFPVECAVAKKEGFEDTQRTTCPSGSKTFIDEKGATMCCNGQVNGRKCEGRIVCTFSQSAVSNEIIFCNAIKEIPQALDQLFAIPSRDVTVTQEEIQNGQAYFKNTLDVFRLTYLMSLLRNESAEEKKKSTDLYTDPRRWNQLYSTKADATAFAKEAKYLWTSVAAKEPSPDPRRQEIIDGCITSKGELIQIMKAIIEATESDLKKKNIEFLPAN